MTPESRQHLLDDAVTALRALAEDYATLCGVALQLVPDDQNLPEDILAIWDLVASSQTDGLIEARKDA